MHFLHIHEFYNLTFYTWKFPVFVQYNSCNPASNALVELNLSAWTIYRSGIYFATTDHPLISFILHQLHNIISLQLLMVLLHFSACTVTIMSNNLKLGKLHTISFDPVKNRGERLTFICWAFLLSSGAWRELVWQSLLALIYSSLL